ncbi:MAG: DUF2339 domain-containing protein [Acidimicrobiales bacterium]
MLTSRLDGLEQRFAVLEARLAHRPASGGPAAAMPQAPWPVTAPPQHQPPPPTGRPLAEPPQPYQGVGPPPVPRPKPVRAERAGPEVDTEAVLKWTGLVLVVLAAVFAVSTVIDRGWFGPEAQLAGSAVAGAALVAGGVRLAPSRPAWARTLTGGGAVVLPVTAAAVHAGVDLAGPGVGLALVVVVAAGLSAVAHRLGYESTAVVAATVVPATIVWLAAGDDLAVAVIGLALGAVAVASAVGGLLRRWTVVRVLGIGVASLVINALATGRHGELSGASQVLALAVVAVVAALAWAGPLVAERLGRAADGPVGQLDHRAVAGVPLLAFGNVVAVLGLDGGRVAGVAGLALAAGFAAAAGALLRAAPVRLVGAHLVGAGILGSVAVAVWTTGPVLLVVVAAQAAAVVVLHRWFRDGLLLVQGVILGAVAMAWSGADILAGLVDELAVGQHVGNLVVVVLAAVAAWDARRRSDEPWVAVLVALSWAWALAWVASVAVHQPQGQVIVSAVWAVAAASAIAVGVRADDRLARVVGLVTLAVTVGKLLTVDLAAIDTLWRVGLFLVIGSGLLRLGYVLPRLAGRTAGPPGPG